MSLTTSATTLIRKSRYERLLEDIIKSGIKTKVLLLSATPVNNDLKDLRNQLYFLTEGRDDAFRESIGVASLKETLATAQRTFTNWAKQHEDRKTSDLLEKLSSAFFKLLDELTIARSRKHIQSTIWCMTFIATGHYSSSQMQRCSYLKSCRF